MSERIKEMDIFIKLRICNGFGDIVRNSMKENLMHNLSSETNNAIQPIIQSYPHFTEEFPNNGWSGFDLIIKLPVKVDINKIIAEKAGCFTFIAKRLISSQYIANEIANELSNKIKNKINEKDWIGISASVEEVNINVRKI